MHIAMLTVDAARIGMHCVAPVGEKDEHVELALLNVESCLDALH